MNIITLYYLYNIKTTGIILIPLESYNPSVQRRLFVYRKNYFPLFNCTKKMR